MLASSQIRKISCDTRIVWGLIILIKTNTLRNQNIDVTNFESNMNAFKDTFARNYGLAYDQFSNAIGEIDKTIDVFFIKHLIFNFDRVTFMDSSGIGVIMGRYNKLKI